MPFLSWMASEISKDIFVYETNKYSDFLKEYKEINVFKLFNSITSKKTLF